MTGDRRSTSKAPAIVVGAAFLIVACASSTSSGSGSPGVPSPAMPSRPAASAVPPTAAAIGSTPPVEGERVTGQVLGRGTYPTYSVAIPGDGWSAGDGHFITRIGPFVAGLSVWDVDQVPSDPCHWRSTLAGSGESVGDLVAVLVAQKSRHATTPKAVTLDGHSGQYLEWSVPGDAVVTGDADFAGCDLQGEHRDFVSWMGDGFGERYEELAGQVDHLWVLDVDGLRLVVDATYGPDASTDTRGELARMVETLHFDRS